MNCNWKDCPIHLGFELEFTGEDEEKDFRKSILPIIKKCFKHGMKWQKIKNKLEAK